MGVYVKGMKKKPKDCKACFLGLYDRQAYCRNGEKALCPLIEVKEPHGRLIDESVLNERAKLWMTNFNLGTTLYEQLDEFYKVAEIPIVIEAEEE